ncbi:MAG: TonB-dependent receptor [Gammaproteobacteria bacterium]|jgi:iron complex outermembrane recepter protein|nr:TonB-dependent receptor [Gammaproteobacteria bacterium]MBT4493429.1 TonB-dependent receptor [Gammaproteobacteria bacterium]MBT7369246.1 TonB-dependent receptor [Gammaproteobacteria bacterium]
MKNFSTVVLALVGALGISTSAMGATGQIEEVVVSAQRVSESIQDVPIAVSAFNTEMLEAKQIDTFSDLQFNVPNVSYSKTFFSGNNFQIRGIGNLLVAQSADTGVGMHVNDVYINSPRIFETEYYDMAQVEILRGPQGTLFGRNATGGVVNLKTARPVLGETLYDVDLQVGNYDHRKIKGSFNVPMGDSMAFRMAGIFLDREGYTDNLLGGDIDGRDQWSVRGSFRWDIGDNTRLDIIAHRFEEDSNRSRSQKQLCNQDPSAVLGCIPDSTPTEAINPFSTLAGLLSSDLILGPIGASSFFAFPLSLDPTFGNPSDLREQRLAFEPEYEAEEDFIMLELQHEFANGYDLNLILAHQETTVFSRQDYNGTAANLNDATIPASFCAFSPAACTFFGTQAGGPQFMSSVPNTSSLGAVGGPGHFLASSRGSATDVSDVDAEQDSVEIRITSNLDGRFNFMLAAYFLEYEAAGGYVVQAPGLDYAAVGLINGALGLAGNPDVFGSLAPGYFNTVTTPYELDSRAVFGEVYYEISDTLKLTLGLRHTKDEKSVSDRQSLLNIPVTVDVATGTVSVLGVAPVTNFEELLSTAAGLGVYDADPNTPGGQVFREFEEEFSETTGRIVLDWTPDLSFTDDTMVYFSYSKGYKGGGINPPIDTTLFPNTPTTFDPEDIDAFEVGMKNTLKDGTLQLNGNMFFYDYGGYQIGKIVNRTSLNENTDAEIFGLELEALWAPTENWRLNAAFSYLDTELDDTDTIDPRDPTQGRQDVTLIKDISNTANCIIEHNGQVAPSLNPVFTGTAAAVGLPYLATGAAGGLGIPATPGVSDSAFSVCSALVGLAPALGYVYSDSITTNLKGNEIQNSPEMTISLGGQYTWFLSNGMSFSARLDYYWQDEFFSTTFNRPQDQINSWDIYNAQFVLSGAEDKWSVTAFIQNIEDDDEITGTYQTDPSSGLYTNAFFIEPRLYGVTFKWRN